MENSKRQFQIFLPGLLKVLAESLYSTNRVAIRELLQNAHDSCVRRAVEGREQDYQPRIQVTADQSRGLLVIEDNGAGLTADDIINYLSTIGRSYTREFSEKLSVLAPDEAARLVGQFGLGFLSAFLIATEVNLTTCSAADGGQTFQWRSTGDIHYELTDAPQISVGTRVELVIKPSAAFLLHETTLMEIIRQYADFLATPIYVGVRPFPANTTCPPWQAREPQITILDYIQQHFKIASPLGVIPLTDYVVDLGHDTLTFPLSGFLFVPPTSVASVREYGDVQVYIKGMFICEDVHGLLPTWARFVRGVVESSHLQPTASREAVHKDEAFRAIQQAVESQLIAGLRQIALTDVVSWKRIVQGHSDVIISWAVQDNRFFNQIADLVSFRTSRGLLSLPAYLEKTGGNIYFTRQQLGSLQQRLLIEADDAPVLDASWFEVEPFLRKYAETHSDVRLVGLDDQTRLLMQPVPESMFAALVSDYQTSGILAKVANFKPEVIPAIINYPQDAEFIAETRSALAAGELPPGLDSLIGAMVDRMNFAADTLRGTLYLNASNKLVQALTMMPSGAAREAALVLIYQMARLFSGRMLDAQSVSALFQATNNALKTLIEGD